MNGETIEIWKDRWVRGIRGDRFHHSGILKEDLASKVAEIIYKEEGTWNLSSIEHWLLGEENEDPNGIDRLIWPHNASGCYSIKSGYKIIEKEAEGNKALRPSSSYWMIWKMCCEVMMQGARINAKRTICKKKVAAMEILEIGYNGMSSNLNENQGNDEVN
ncbi:reverse transcriptase [Gossypium australe]|uniref:Reverse transcriptase n=1 Tax=Gossypium australe TaxID=47621 RepID=A0A5B6VCW6_9ROSI|nr:reverse transcriptase [Gossypium australe]